MLLALRMYIINLPPKLQSGSKQNMAKVKSESHDIDYVCRMTSGIITHPSCNLSSAVSSARHKDKTSFHPHFRQVLFGMEMDLAESPLPVTSSFLVEPHLRSHSSWNPVLIKHWLSIDNVQFALVSQHHLWFEIKEQAASASH